MANFWEGITKKETTELIRLHKSAREGTIMTEEIKVQNDPVWQIIDVEMVDRLKGDEVVERLPVAHFQVRNIPSQSWVHDYDLGMVELMNGDGQSFKVTKNFPTELIEQCDEVQRIMQDIDKTFLDVEIDGWTYHLKTCTFSLVGSGIIH